MSSAWARKEWIHFCVVSAVLKRKWKNKKRDDQKRQDYTQGISSGLFARWDHATFCTSLVCAHGLFFIINTLKLYNTAQKQSFTNMTSDVIRGVFLLQDLAAHKQDTRYPRKRTLLGSQDARLLVRTVTTTLEKVKNKRSYDHENAVTASPDRLALREGGLHAGRAGLAGGGQMAAAAPCSM